MCWKNQIFLLLYNCCSFSFSYILLMTPFHVLIQSLTLYYLTLSVSLTIFISVPLQHSIITLLFSYPNFYLLSPRYIFPFHHYLPFLPFFPHKHSIFLALPLHFLLLFLFFFSLTHHYSLFLSLYLSPSLSVHVVLF